jgi:hypothetical protein
MKYEWKITGIKRKDASSENLNNIIVQTYWKKIGTDENGNSAEFQGATPFDVSTVDKDNFTNYEDLTEEMVLDWIKSVVVDSYEEHVNYNIQKQIDEKINPIVEERNEFPWGSVDEVIPITQSTIDTENTL